MLIILNDLTHKTPPLTVFTALWGNNRLYWKQENSKISIESE